MIFEAASAGYLISHDQIARRKEAESVSLLVEIKRQMNRVVQRVNLGR